MTDWRLIPASASFAEFNRCHTPAGSPAGGQFCATDTAKQAAIGLIRHGQVEVKTLHPEDADSTTHLDAFGWAGAHVDGGQRFRYRRGKVIWDEPPSDEDYFKVEDEFASRGMPVKGQVLLLWHEPVRRPTPKFQEFNRCHNPAGPNGGQFCSTGSTENTAIGMLTRNGVEIVDLKQESSTSVMHSDVMRGFAQPEKRFRYDYGDVIWDEVPTNDDLFTVENEFENRGWHVKAHALLYGGLVPRPAPPSARSIPKSALGRRNPKRRYAA